MVHMEMNLYMFLFLLWYLLYFNKTKHALNSCIHFSKDKKSKYFLWLKSKIKQIVALCILTSSDSCDSEIEIFLAIDFRFSWVGRHKMVHIQFFSPQNVTYFLLSQPPPPTIFFLSHTKYSSNYYNASLIFLLLMN